MQKIVLVLLAFALTLKANAQADSATGKGNFIGQVLNNLSTQIDPDNINDIKNGLVKDTSLYNMIWNDLINSSTLSKWHFLKDLNVQFKTFQGTDTNSVCLGLTYSFNYSYGTSKDYRDTKVFQDFGVTANGNVAYKKALNPANLLETNIHYDYMHYKGGQLQKKDSAFFAIKKQIRHVLDTMSDVHSPAAIKLWQALGEGMQFSNEYYYGISPTAGFETNQDFSKVQFTPGALLTLGAKAWSDENPLAKCNIFDYPFALLRLIFRTDRSFTPYGSTIPMIQLGFNYVVPSNDSTREKITGNTNPYPRFKLETAFKTLVSTIDKQNVFFSCDFRLYQEINPPAGIKKAKLDQQTYFVMALESANGFYVSYSTGQLPFDLKSDQIYSLGFNYKF